MKSNNDAFARLIYLFFVINCREKSIVVAGINNSPAHKKWLCNEIPPRYNIAKIKIIANGTKIKSFFMVRGLIQKHFILFCFI